MTVATLSSVSDTPLKSCTKCGVDKPVSEFHKDASTKDGLRRWCKDCAKDHHVQHREQRNAKLRERYAADEEYRKSKCANQSGRPRRYGPYIEHAAKPFETCSVDGCGEDGVLSGMCRPHYMADWHQQNKDRRYQKVKERLAVDPDFRERRRKATARKEQERRAQKAGTEYTKILQYDYDRILAEYGNCCWVCELPLDKVYWDHYQPLAKGGAHVVSNLRPSCNPCNTRKNSLWPFTDEMKRRIAAEVRALRTSQSITGSVTDGEEVMADVIGNG